MWLISSVYKNENLLWAAVWTSAPEWTGAPRWYMRRNELRRIELRRMNQGQKKPLDTTKA